MSKSEGDRAAMALRLRRAGAGRRKGLTVLRQTGPYFFIIAGVSRGGWCFGGWWLFVLLELGGFYGL